MFLFRWLKRLFKKKKKYASYGNPGIEFNPAWGVIVPHTRKRPGAYSHTQQTSEYMYAIKMLVTSKLKSSTRDDGGVYGAAKRLKSVGCNASVEPHKNAFNGKAKGFEILYIKGDALSKQYAIKIIEQFKLEFPDRILRRNHGLFPVGRRDRGYKNLLAAKDGGMEVALLSESFFLDNDSEWIEPSRMAKFWEDLLL